jgi:hypothetical protein
MNSVVKATSALLGALCLVGGCAATGPLYEPVSAIPPGYGLVYIYEDAGSGPVTINHDNKKLASLQAGQYLFHFADRGANVYSFPSDFFQRGGIFGAMGLVDFSRPQPVVLMVEPGKTYYLKVIGAGANVNFWRVDQEIGSRELLSHHRVDTE